MTEQEIIEDILDEFDFKIMQETMEALDWTWHDTGEDIPSLGQLRKKARELMKSCIGQDSYTISCAGFYIDKTTFNGKPYYSLKFVVTEWDNYE